MNPDAESGLKENVSSVSGFFSFSGISIFFLGLYFFYLAFPEPKVKIASIVILSVLLWGISIVCLFVGPYLIINRKRPEIRERLICFRGKYPRLYQLLMGLLIDLWIFFLAETVFLGLNHLESKKVQWEGDEPHFMVPDAEMGYKPKPDATIHVRRISEGKPAYDAYYHTDSMNRRKTPQSGQEKRVKFAFFFGCSITFGVGVQDDQTMEYYFAEKAKDHLVYNYSCPGYGPQSLLTKLKKNDLKKEISPSNGALFFVFFDDHLNRVAGSTWVYNAWVHDLPYCFLDKSDNLIKDGNFDTGRPLTSFFYRLIWRTQTVSFNKIEFPLYYGPEHFHLVARIFEESYKTFKEQFPSSKFFVVFFPGASYSRNLVPLLKERKVPFLDYSGILDILEKGKMIEGDGHPTPLTHKIFGEKLADEVSTTTVIATETLRTHRKIIH